MSTYEFFLTNVTFTNNLKFASQAGVVFFNLNTITGKLEIGANTEFTGTIRAAREVTVRANVMEVKDPDGFGPDNLWIWKGSPILDQNGEPDYDALTKQNASLGWRDLNANEYFGGSVTTGQLINSGDTTLLTLNPSVEVGPFTTNGNPKTVSCSFSWRGTYTQDEACPTNPTFVPEATVILERSTGGGGWAELQRQVFNGTVTYTEFYDFEHGVTTCTMLEISGGSFTYTDTSTSLATFAYRLRVEGQRRALRQQFIDSQRLSLISVEGRPS